MVLFFSPCNDGFDPPLDKRRKEVADELIEQSNMSGSPRFTGRGGIEYYPTRKLWYCTIL